VSPPYVELRAKSAFSFLRGASNPEDLANRAADLGYEAMAIADAGGVYGAPRFHLAAKERGLRALIGSCVHVRAPAEPDARTGGLSSTRASRAAQPPGPPDPSERRSARELLLLCKSREGYQNLCRAITLAKSRRTKAEATAGLAALEWDELAAHSSGLFALAGSSDDPLGAALDRGDPEGAEAVLGRLLETFGAGNLALEITAHARPQDDWRNLAILDLARRHGVMPVVTGDVRYTTPERADLFDVLTCIRHKTTLDAARTLLARGGERHLRGPEEVARAFRDVPDAVANTLRVAEACAFTLADLGYRFPAYPLPPGHSPDTYLAHLCDEFARWRYGTRIPADVRGQLGRELALIAKLKLAGYFLIVWDIVQFCRREGIIVQGRGSAANSIVCYVLGITAIDPVRMDLLFERFLSEERGEWPDIDLDLPSGDLREKVIQYVYRRYGERGAAMTANVITYRARSAAREIAKVLGFGQEHIDRLAALLPRFEFEGPERDAIAPPSQRPGKLPPPGGGQSGGPPPTFEEQLREAGFDPSELRVRHFARLCRQIGGLPRHLGQHSGGMVVSMGNLDQVVPIEPAAMEGRAVLQWDKEDCTDLGLIKIDLLGLGMLGALQEVFPLIRVHDGADLDLASIPPDDPETYAMIRAADTVGVFQIESRAQMATLPRMRPENFYDLVVEVAIIRPGPIVGQMVNPYLERRNGRQEVVYPHPSLEPILKRTLGVPLFQEQLMRLAMVAAGFSGGQAEELRRAMGFRRSNERMERIYHQLVEGLERNGITGRARDEIILSITSFALYGFPESHAASFALIAYASSYLRAHHLACFLCALLNHWPMGFYNPATLVKDAQRHGVRVLPVDVTRSDWSCTVERVDAANAVRIGLRYVKGLGREAALRVEEERRGARFRDLADFVRRVPLKADQLDTLAEIGAFAAFGRTRRDALWQVAALGRWRQTMFDGESEGEHPLDEMGQYERTVGDFRGTELTVGPHPVAYLRPRLRAEGVLSAVEVAGAPAGGWAWVAGVVITRQRPMTAKGFCFISLEDETGIANVIARPDVFATNRAVILSNASLRIGGVVLRQDGVTNLQAREFRPLEIAAELPGSHDFR
jgi:error-prone DNA polymerase